MRRAIFDRSASMQSQYAIEFCFLMESNDLFALIDCCAKRTLLSNGGNITSYYLPWDISLCKRDSDLRTVVDKKIRTQFNFNF